MKVARYKDEHEAPSGKACGSSLRSELQGRVLGTCRSDPYIGVHIRPAAGKPFPDRP